MSLQIQCICVAA